MLCWSLTGYGRSPLTLAVVVVAVVAVVAAEGCFDFVVAVVVVVASLEESGSPCSAVVSYGWPFS